MLKMSINVEGEHKREGEHKARGRAQGIAPTMDEGRMASTSVEGEYKCGR
jgi:hypothetical protein